MNPIVLSSVGLALAVLLMFVAAHRVRKEGFGGEAGLVFVPFTAQPSPLTATMRSAKKARFDTRAGGRLVARLVGFNDGHLFLRRGNGPVFRRRRVN